MSAKISPSSDANMESMLAKLISLENGLNSMRDQQKSMREQHKIMRDQHTEEVKSMRDQHAEEMKSVRMKHTRDMKSLRNRVQLIEAFVRNGDASSNTAECTHEAMMQKAPQNKQQLGTPNCVHTTVVEVVGCEEKRDDQVDDNPTGSSDADRALMEAHDAESDSQPTIVSDTENDEVLQQLQDKFASEGTKRTMTSENVQTYLPYPGYSGETPISPAQSCCSATWMMFITLLLLSTTLLTVLQRAFCHPVLLAMTGSGSWHGLDIWDYDTSSEIEELATQNLTIDQHVDGSYFSVGICLLNLRPMACVSYFVLALTIGVFINQHGHLLVGPKFYTRLFCDNRPRVAHVRCVYITAVCTLRVCELGLAVNAGFMADYWMLLLAIVPAIAWVPGMLFPLAQPWKTHQFMLHRFFKVMVATALPTLVFLLSCSFRSWAALQHSFADVLSAAVETGSSNYTKTSLVEATAGLPPAFYEIQDWFATACALGWLMPFALLCVRSYIEKLRDRRFFPFPFPTLEAIFKFEVGILDFIYFIIWPLIFFSPQLARVFHHGGVLTVYPVQFFLTMFDDCAVALGEVWCGEAVGSRGGWSPTRALELLTGAGTTSWLDGRLWSNWMLLIGPVTAAGKLFFCYSTFKERSLRSRFWYGVTKAIDTFWRHRRRFTGPEDFLPISKELGAQMLRTTRFHGHVSYLHSLQENHFRRLDDGWGGTLKPHFSEFKPWRMRFRKEKTEYHGRAMHRPSLVLVARYLIRRVHEAKAPENKRVLRVVVTTLRSPHKTIYDATMIGIKQQPMYRDLIGLATRVQDELETLYGVGFKPKQFDPTTGVGAETFRELYNGGISACKMYDPMLRTLGEKTGGDAKVAPMKGFWRVLEKLFVVPGIADQWPMDAPVTPEDVDAAVQSLAPADIVRGWIEFDNVSQMKLALGLLAGADERLRGLEGAVDSHIVGLGFNLEIMRIKNRFDRPTDAGWADMLVNFRFRPDPNEEPKDYPEQGDNPYWHVCEIQLVHSQMSLVRRQMGAHHMYSKFRSAMELLEALGERM